MQGGTGQCSAIKWISVNGKLHLLVGFSTGKVASYSMNGDRVKRDSAVSVGVAITSLAYSVKLGVLLLGCADGGLRLITLRDGARFDTRPTLWTKVNNQSSPGITSIDVIDIGLGESQKCLCCTGGSDGSVALFEIHGGLVS